MYSFLIATYVLVPLVLGVSFASRYRRELHKPALAAFVVVAEGYGVAMIVAVAVSYRTLSRIGLSGQVSYGSNPQETIGVAGPLVLAILVILNLALLWWNFRVLPKKS
jgi:hypothetical protein